jgi:hypothetical protein
MSLNSIKACNDRLAALGHKRQVFSNLKNAQAAVSAAEARKAGKPILAPGKPIAPISPTGLPPSPIKDGVRFIQDLKASAKMERDPSRKADMLTDLSGRLLSAISAESDVSKKADLYQEYKQVELKRAYALLAERTAAPAEARIRRLMDAASS